MSYLLNCPKSLDAVKQAAQEVAGSTLNCEIIYGHINTTIFSEDGSKTTVIVDRKHSIQRARIILVHLLSHVVCGQSDESHGPEFKRVYDQIYDRYAANKKAGRSED